MLKSNYINHHINWIVLASIVVISLVMHFSHFEKDLMGLHVWRQTQTQSNIVSFYEEDMNILNPRRNDRGDDDGIFRLEFPLMQWLVAASYNVFGNHLVISRIWMFVIGIFSVLGIYKLLKALFDKEILALMGAWAFNFSPGFYYYTINPLPDNLALCCSIWGLAIFFLYQKKGGLYKLAFSGLLLSAGALTKLPFILYFAVPLVFYLLEGRKASSWHPSVLKATIVSIFIILPIAWYVSVIPQWYGNGIVGGMLENSASVSVLMGNFTHHLFITLPDLLLNYGSLLFFMAGFYFIFKNKAYKNPLFPVFAVWGLILALYFLFELNMIGKSHDYYLFPFFPALFILVAYGAYHLFLKKRMFTRVFVIILLLILPVTAYLRIDDRWNPEKPGFNKDLLIYKEELREAVPKDALCIAGNDKSHFIFFYYIDKKGWAFEGNELDEEKIRDMVNRGAKYLYSDSREIDSHPEILPYLEELILEKGSVRVFRLKVR